MENKNYFAISNVLPGKLNAMVKNIMKKIGVSDPEEAVRMVNAGEVQISLMKPKWTEKDSIIRFSVRYNGSTGKEFVFRLKDNGIEVSNYARSILLSKSFKSGKPTVYKIAVLKGELFSDSERITKNIRKEASSRKFIMPNVLIAYLIREKFSSKELEAMGLRFIVIMHEPIKDSGDNPSFLAVNRDSIDPMWDSDYVLPDGRWRRDYGFAFITS